MDERSIKKSIKKIREEMGLSQEEMAGELGFSDGSSYWRFEDGGTRIINQKLYQLSEISGHPVEEILLGAPLDSLLRSEQIEEKLEKMKAYYEDKLADQDKTITNLNDYIKSLKDTIRNLKKNE